jgi:hypothetical protein
VLVSCDPQTFHLPCALVKRDICFIPDKWEVYCPTHGPEHGGHSHETADVASKRRLLRVLSLPACPRATPKAKNAKQKGQVASSPVPGKQAGTADSPRAASQAAVSGAPADDAGVLGSGGGQQQQQQQQPSPAKRQRTEAVPAGLGSRALLVPATGDRARKHDADPGQQSRPAALKSHAAAVPPTSAQQQRPPPSRPLQPGPLPDPFPVPQQQQQRQQQSQQQGQEPAGAASQGEQAAAAVGPGQPAMMVVEAAERQAGSAGAAPQLPAAVRELVAEVFGEPAPALLVRVEAYLWEQGLRSFRRGPQFASP